MLKDAEEFARAAAAAAEPAAAPAELQTEIGARMERAEAAELQPDVAGVEAAGGTAAGLLQVVKVACVWADQAFLLRQRQMFGFR